MAERRTINRAHILSRGQVAIDSWTVPFANQRWRAQHPTDASLTQYFHSSVWLAPTTADDIPEAVELLIAQARANPDPGAYGNRQAFNARGWNESAITLRLGTALCVYDIASDDDKQRLLPVLEVLIDAAKDSGRYYGPPRAHAHNHGVMSDRGLLEAAAILNRPELARFAERRLTTQLDGLYDTCGLNYEQSNGYQHFHASLWRQVSKYELSPAFTSKVRKKLVGIRQGASALTWPDGFSPPIGNGRARALSKLSRVSGDVSLHCPETGWFSWRTTRANLTQQVLARFGPATAFHGHDDKGSIFWWVGQGNTGTQVLVDRGLSGKRQDARRVYSESSAAHPTLIWPGGSGLPLSGRRTTGGDVTTLTIQSNPSSTVGTWRRTATMSRTKAQLVIRDTITGPSASRPATSNLPLDPGWRPTQTPGVYESLGGARLTIECTTHSGAHVRVRDTWTPDFQEGQMRRGFTATCTVPTAGKGLTAILRVVE